MHYPKDLIALIADIIDQVNNNFEHLKICKLSIIMFTFAVEDKFLYVNPHQLFDIV